MLINADGKLTFSLGNKNLLSYRYTVYPPVGADTNYKRNCFIHPRYAPHGQKNVYTKILAGGIERKGCCCKSSGNLAFFFNAQ